ncbi:asparagine synthase domain protein [Mycobacterium kansasii]|uniref:Asparagine synthase domain protein n=1 Tax=Mycobacterium kansasii TaxID=1768 RepID=A0A1V3WP55_MYCKA|nr:asparagine synthase domain protein [Mycobacterium kansasii]
MSNPSKSTRSSRHFFSLATAVPPAPVARNSGLMPNGSRAQNNSRVTVSQSAKANMPRSRLSTSVPQWW